VLVEVHDTDLLRGSLSRELGREVPLPSAPTPQRRNLVADPGKSGLEATEVEGLQRDLAAARWKLQVPPAVTSPAGCLSSSRSVERCELFDCGIAQSFHLIRHGSAAKSQAATDMNGDVASPGGGAGMDGPWSRSTPVPPRHEREEQQVIRRVSDGIAVDLVVVAPMAKSLRTAMAGFGGRNVPIIAHPGLLHQTRGGDLTQVADLVEQYPEVDLSALHAHLFQHNAATKGIGFLTVEESARSFEIRIAAFREWLLSRPERSVAVVGHGEVILRLAGVHLHHCQVLTVPRSALISTTVSAI